MGNIMLIYTFTYLPYIQKQVSISGSKFIIHSTTPLEDQHLPMYQLAKLTLVAWL